MNTVWFRKRLSERRLSQRGLARLLGLDAAAVSLMLRGQRRMSAEEAHRISGLIGVPITEVLRQAGVDVTDDVRMVSVTGYISSDALVTLFPRGTYDHVVGPADCPTGTYALQKRSPQSPQDGWMYFVSPIEDDPREHLGQLCCVALATGEHMVCFVHRGYRSGTYNLLRCTGQAERTDAAIAWASRVLWVRPS